MIADTIYVEYDGTVRRIHYAVLTDHKPCVPLEEPPGNQYR
jgi:hypothetical protein